jgi:hypothetical protein
MGSGLTLRNRAENQKSEHASGAGFVLHLNIPDPSVAAAMGRGDTLATIALDKEKGPFARAFY